MKTKYCVILLILLSFITFNGCNRFLDVEPEGRLILSKLQDYELLLNGDGLSRADYQVTDFMSDDMDDLTSLYANPSIGIRIYLWKDEFDLNISESPVFWGAAYAGIYGYNVVINEVENASTGTSAEKQKLKAEALVRRAFDYLWLINLYAKPYNTLTAETELAVPYVTSSDIGDQIPERATVSFIYKKIIEEIKDAIPYLPATNSSNKFRGSVNSAYSILARTYYYMSDYSQASRYADLALSEPNTSLLDYNTIKKQEELPLISISKQEIYARNFSLTFPRTGGIVSADLLGLLKNEDLRSSLFYRLTGMATFPDRGSVIFINPVPGKISFGTSVPEMKLIIAEAAARNNNPSVALEQLNGLRKARIAVASYSALSSSDRETILQWILTERRLELAFRGVRWMDMRKLDSEHRMPTIKRLDFNGKTIATLAPNSPKYTLKIPASVLHFNPGMIQN